MRRAPKIREVSEAKTRRVDAVITFSPPPTREPFAAVLRADDKETTARLRVLTMSPRKQSAAFVRLETARPFALRWGDRFSILHPEDLSLWGEGRVLYPFIREHPVTAEKRWLRILEHLDGDEKDFVFGAALKGGIQGIREKDLLKIGHLSAEDLLKLSQELEVEGKVKILGFRPLFLISQSGFEFLCEKICRLLSRYHKQHPDDIGMPQERIGKRFDLSLRILTLCLTFLSQKGQVKIQDGRVARADFSVRLLPEEEQILAKMEEMVLRGEFPTLSAEDLKKSFRLSSKRLGKLLAILVERRKIIQGQRGYLIHARYLDEIIHKL
ncbi:MAG: DNA/RNA-binding winged helix domain-containing protein, partial [Candidatus Aminicenantales bacterium]